jgi:cyclophilin family peptidyl-prolyl cis-trans isomerase
MCIDPNVRLDATVVTNLGTFVIALDPSSAPLSVNSFVVLARYHFYDGVDFHRIVTDFVAQAGDANGTGGPGYAIPDEPPSRPYRIGTVAIANAGRNTNGSQFFIVLGNGDSIGPQYPLIGQITVGLGVVTDQIGALGTVDGTPTGEATILRITIAG